MTASRASTKEALKSSGTRNSRSFATRVSKIATAAANHGDFVSGVAALTNAWVSEGIISGREKGAIQSCAAKAKLP